MGTDGVKGGARRVASRGATAVRFGGFTRSCPVCGARLRRMRPTPSGRINASCPSCASMERHRLLWLYLEREQTIRTRSVRVLHVAPEAGIEARLRGLKNVEYTSTDLGDLEATVQADLTDLPFDAGTFDLVICSHVLEHIPDDVAAMREMRRVLAPGGAAILQHPIDTARADTYEDFSITTEAGRRAAFLQGDHVRIYGRDILARLQSAGFEVDILDYNERLSAAERTRFCTVASRSSDPALDLQGDALYVCRSAAGS